MRVLAVAAILIASPAFGQAPPVPRTPLPEVPAPTAPGTKEKPSFFREDGQPKNKYLLRASRACHAHNPDPGEAKANCAVFDGQVTKRATETDATQDVKDRAGELAK